MDAEASRVRSLPSVAMTLPLFGRYGLLKRFGTGGTSELWTAIPQPRGEATRPLLLKRILPQLAKAPEATGLFLQEAKLGAPLEHPNIIRILDFGVVQGLPYLAREFVHGEDLNGVQRLARRRPSVLTPERALHILASVCEALAFAYHGVDPQGRPRRLIHGELAARHVLIGSDGVVKVIGFRGGKAVDPRTDLFNAGLLLQELLTGMGPLERDPERDALVRKAIAREPDDRYQDPRDFLRALEAYLKAQWAAPRTESLQAMMYRLTSSEDTPRPPAPKPSPSAVAPRPTVGRVPHAGIWLDNFSLTTFPGGVLLAGGVEWHPELRATGSAALWGASTHQWLQLPPMPSPRKDHAAVCLPDGRVLLVGGSTDEASELASTLFWEPETRRFREGPPLLQARSRPAAVTLTDGAVLVVGAGLDEDEEPGLYRYTPRGTRAELLRPGASAWEPAGEAARLFHVGPVCASHERVLLVSGQDMSSLRGSDNAPPLQCSELWEREGLTWRLAGSRLEPRQDAEAITLSDGRILVVGGWFEDRLLGTAEVWDPRTDRWSPAGVLSRPRTRFALVALPEGRAAVCGGFLEGSALTNTVELWEPQQGTWSSGPPLGRARAGHRLVSVGPGTFLVVGGSRSSESDTPQLTWELWQPAP